MTVLDSQTISASSTRRVIPDRVKPRRRGKRLGQFKASLQPSARLGRQSGAAFPQIESGLDPRHLGTRPMTSAARRNLFMWFLTAMSKSVAHSLSTTQAITTASTSCPKLTPGKSEGARGPLLPGAAPSPPRQVRGRCLLGNQPPVMLAEDGHNGDSLTCTPARDGPGSGH